MIAEHVAARRGVAVDHVLPQTVGHVALALSLAAYEQWLRHPHEPLGAQLSAATEALVDYLTP